MRMRSRSLEDRVLMTSRQGASNDSGKLCLPNISPKRKLSIGGKRGNPTHERVETSFACQSHRNNQDELQA